MRIHSAFLAAALLPAITLAQETTTAVSALRITTNDRSVAREVLQMFDSEAELPTLGDGTLAVLSLDDGGKITLTEGSGDAWLKIEARPAQLMEIFGAQVAQGQQMAQMMGGMALGQAGFGFEDVDTMVTAAFAFPKQIDALVVSIPTEYEPGEAMDVTVDLDPKAGTWFGSLVTNLEPLASGVPQLGGTGNAMVRMGANIDMAKVLPQLLPMMGLFAGIGQTDKEAKAAAARVMKTYYEGLSGAMSVAFDMENGAKVIMGASDPAKLKSAMADPAYLQMTKASSEASGMVEAIVDLEAMTHRDVTVLRTEVIYDDPDMAPFSEDGTMETYAAVAGNFVVSSMMGGAKAGIQAMIDDALDGKIERTQLPGGALMVADVDVRSFIDFIASQGGMPANADDAPETMGAQLSKTQKGLNLKVRIH